MATGFFTRSTAGGVATGAFDHDGRAAALFESNIANARGLAAHLELAQHQQTNVSLPFKSDEGGSCISLGKVVRSS